MVTRIDKTGTPPAPPPPSSTSSTPPAAPPPPAGPPGGVESLDDIARSAAQLDAPKVDAKAQQQVLASEREEIETALQLLRKFAVPLAPQHTHQALEMLWSDRQLREIAEAIVECCRASGVKVSEWFTKYGPWVRLGMVLGMPSLATLKLLRSPAPQPVQQADQVDHGQHQPA